MKLTKLGILSVALSVAGLVLNLFQNHVDGELTEAFVREEVREELKRLGMVEKEE